MRKCLSGAASVLLLCSVGAALAQNGDLGVFGGGDTPAQPDFRAPPQTASPPAWQPVQAPQPGLIDASEVFIAVGARKSETLAGMLAREYYRDFRSAAVALLRDGRWVALAGWTPRDASASLISTLSQAGRIPRTSFTVSGDEVSRIVWSAVSPATRDTLQIPANVRRSPILTGMGVTGSWAPTPAACARGFNREDLLEGTLKVEASGFVWGSFGRCSIGSVIRVGGGVFLGASCTDGRDQDRFVVSMRRRGPRLEVIIDPAKPNKLYYQLDWCARPGEAVARRSQPPGGTRVARAPDTPRPAAGGDAPVRKAKSTGSGFFVSSAGHLVTNEHVVRKCEEVFVKGFGRAQVVEQDARNDLALLKLRPSKPVPFLKVRTAPVQLGQEVVVFGYPLSSILNNGLNVTTGIVSSETGIRNDQRMIQFTAAIQPGNSGGPVVDRSGNLVAVVKAKFSDKFALDRGNFVPQNLNFGIRTTILTRFLSDNGVTAQKADASAERSVADLTAAARMHTMLVTCH